MKFSCVYAAVLAVIMPVSLLADDRLRVERLSDANWDELSPRGPDAIAGIGDWALSNGRLCAVVSDLDHESGLTAFGGILVDLGHCGAENDQWLLAHLVPNMDTNSLTRPQSLHTGSSSDAVFITVQGEQQGLRLESRYQLGLEQRDILTVVHTVTRVSDGPALNTLGKMILHPGRSLTPYALNTARRQYSLGFDWLAVDRSDQAVMLRAMQPGDLSVLLGADGLKAPVSYGVSLDRVLLTDANGDSRALGNFVITGSDYTMFGILSEQPWLGGAKPGLWEMLQSRLMDLAPGASLELSFSILVVPANNVAQVTNRHYRGAWVSGRVNGLNSRLHIADGEGNPLTSVSLVTDGHFRVRLPEDVKQVQARLVSTAGEESWHWTIDQPEVDVGVLALTISAVVRLPQGNPMRLIFKGMGETPDPVFFDDFTGVNSGGELWPNSRQANYISLAGVADDLHEVTLPGGQYRVYASRGLEFTVTEAELAVVAGEQVDLIIDWPMRALATGGLVSADLHVHSGISFDSTLPLRERVRSFVAAGAEILVASEHNRLIDYRQLVRDMGLADSVQIITGVEFTGMAHTEATPYTNGHSNAFPLQYRPRQFSGGLPPHEGVRLRDLMQWTREQSPAALFQLNHPRILDAPDPALAYFDHLGVGQNYDPDQPLSAPANSALIEVNAHGIRDVDFDLIEVLNGNDMALYRLVRSDWFSLLRQGLRITGTANSDSHKSGTLVAVPTNYVSLVDSPDPAEAEHALLQGLRQGRVIGSNGPILRVELHNDAGASAGIGGQLSGDNHVLTVSVAAAPWIPLDKLTVYLNGKEYYRREIRAGDTASIPVQAKGGGESFVVVEVTGTADERYSAVLPGFTPLAFSNPIWIVRGEADQIPR